MLRRAPRTVGASIFRPRFTGTASRRAAAIAASNRARFRTLLARRPVGLPATRGFRPLGLRSTGEKKVIDIASGAYQVNTTGVFTLLNGCTQGSDYTDRIGRKIVMRSLYIRGHVFAEPGISTNSLPQQARMILFMDSQPNGAAPAVTDLLNTADAASQLNLNNRDRFKVIRDQTFVFGPQVWSNVPAISVSGTPSISDVNVFIRMFHETIYNAGNAGTIGDINSGALYMFWIGSQPAGSGTDSNAFVSTRVRFVDP